MKQNAEVTFEAEIEYCETREQLKNAYLDAVRNLTFAQDLQLEAVIKDEPGFTRFDDVIEHARRAKDLAKYALIAHLEDHCSPGHASRSTGRCKTYPSGADLGHHYHDRHPAGVDLVFNG